MLGFLLFAAILPAISFAQHSPDIVARFNHAVELQRRGAFQEAEAEYRAVLAADPDYAEAHANLGAVLMRSNRYQDAIVSYQTALRLASNLTPVLLNLGIAHYRKGEFEKAIETLKKFLQTSPDNAQAVQLAGLSLVELGRDREAIEFLNQALAATPDDPAVLYATGLASLRLHQPEFDRIVDHLAEVEGGRALSHLLRGQGFLIRLEWERAVQELESAARLNPDLPRLQYSLGLAYFKLSRNPDALAAFEKEVRHNPKDFSSLYYLANLQEAGGDIPAALQNLEKALALDPDSPEANTLLGKIRSKQGKLNEALRPLETAVAKDSTDPEKRYLLARLYQQLGRHEEAKKQFAEVQRLKNEQLEKDRSRMPKP
ncbi:MAG TPA: tetratricopeptide repeat protein [Acidobacteriota bacterium]|jgi:tetratricopeptide (TPR) repeat protein|nr:tetratricopeptide repeat protein [Acidobacteriota bacterium]